MVLLRKLYFKVRCMSSELTSPVVVLPAIALWSPMNFLQQPSLCKVCQLSIPGFWWLSLRQSSVTLPAVALYTLLNNLKQSCTRCCRCDFSIKGVSCILPFWSTSEIWFALCLIIFQRTLGIYFPHFHLVYLVKFPKGEVKRQTLRINVSGFYQWVMSWELNYQQFRMAGTSRVTGMVTARRISWYSWNNRARLQKFHFDLTELVM